MNETFICAHCGSEYPIEDRYIFDSQELCRDCYGTETCVCDQCGERIWLDDDCGDANHTLCLDSSDYYRVSWTNVDTARLDTKRLKAEKPDIYQNFAKITSSRRLTIRAAS